jgi:hypothetical protein
VLHLLIAVLVAAGLILPAPLLGRHVERRRRLAGERAVAFARRETAERRARPPALPPARAITPEEELEQKLEAVNRVPNRRTEKVLNRLEARWHSELDRVLQRAFDALKLDEVDREWAVLGTGEYAIAHAG